MRVVRCRVVRGEAVAFLATERVEQAAHCGAALHTHTHTHTHTWRRCHSGTQSVTQSVTHSVTQSVTQAVTQSLSHSLSLSLTYIEPCSGEWCRIIHMWRRYHLYTQSLSHSVTQSLSLSLTQSLTHTFWEMIPQHFAVTQWHRCFSRNPPQ